MPTRQAWKEIDIRRSHRMAAHGRAFEETVESYLGELKEVGQLESFIRNQPCSEADNDGKDFTVSRKIGGTTVEKSFGVTISLKSWGRSKRLHPKIPQFCFPIGTKKETIIKRILGLFEQSRNGH